MSPYKFLTIPRGSGANTLQNSPLRRRSKRPALLFLLLLVGVVASCATPSLNRTIDVIKSSGQTEYEKLRRHFRWLDYHTYHIIKINSERRGVPVELICSVIQYESGDACRNNVERMRVVRSHSGAIGIMQIMPFHVKNPKTLYNPWTNIERGTWYLWQCIGKSRGDIREACRMYNQGLYGQRWKYKNWGYVNRIYAKYLAATGPVMVAAL